MIELFPRDDKPPVTDTSDGDDFKPTSMWEPVRRYSIYAAITMPLAFAYSFRPRREGGQLFSTITERIIFSLVVTGFVVGAAFWKDLND